MTARVKPVLCFLAATALLTSAIRFSVAQDGGFEAGLEDVEPVSDFGSDEGFGGFEDVADDQQALRKQSRNIFLHPGQNRIELVRSSWRLLEAQVDGKIIAIKSVEASSNNIVRVSSSKDGLRIEAHEPGISSLVLRDDAGRVYDVEFLVTGNTRHLDHLLRKLHPNAAVETTEVADSTILLRGKVETAEEATRIVEIAEALYPKVLNHLAVRGGRIVVQLEQDEMLEGEVEAFIDVTGESVVDSLGTTDGSAFEPETGTIATLEAGEFVAEGQLLTDLEVTNGIAAGATEVDIPVTEGFLSDATVGFEDAAGTVTDRVATDSEFGTEAAPAQLVDDSDPVGPPGGNPPQAAAGGSDMMAAMESGSRGPTTQIRFFQDQPQRIEIQYDADANRDGRWDALAWSHTAFAQAGGGFGQPGGYGRGASRLVASVSIPRSRPIAIRMRTQDFRDNVWVGGWMLASPAVDATRASLQHFPVDITIPTQEIINAARGEIVTRVITIARSGRPGATPAAGAMAPQSDDPPLVATGPDSYRNLVRAWKGHGQIVAAIIIGPEGDLDRAPYLLSLIQGHSAMGVGGMMEMMGGYGDVGMSGMGSAVMGGPGVPAADHNSDPVAREMKRLRQDVQALRGEIARLIQVLKTQQPKRDQGAGADSGGADDGDDFGFGSPGGQPPGIGSEQPGPPQRDSLDGGISAPGTAGGFDSNGSSSDVRGGNTPVPGGGGGALPRRRSPGAGVPARDSSEFNDPRDSGAGAFQNGGQPAAGGAADSGTGGGGNFGGESSRTNDEAGVRRAGSESESPGSGGGSADSSGGTTPIDEPGETLPGLTPADGLGSPS